VVTEVAYVLSAGYLAELQMSLGSLLATGSDFDRVSIYRVGGGDNPWRFEDARVVVKDVPTRFGEYFHGNKLYVCDCPEAGRVIFLDADTLVLKPLDHLFAGRNDVDFMARVATKYYYGDWDQAVWRETCTRAGAGLVPMFNAGVLVFQNGMHRRVENDWASFMKAYLLEQWPAPCGDARMKEQWGLALAIGASRCNYLELDAREHAYRWNEDPPEEAVVYHYGHEGRHGAATAKTDRLLRAMGIAPARCIE
jgi:hypothetical protein